MDDAKPPTLTPDRVASIVRSGQREAVYDITVEHDHEFIANGILVHNSLDAGRYGVLTTEKRWRRYMPALQQD